MWHIPETLHHVNPGSPLYVRLTQNNGDVMILQQGQSRDTIITAEQLPLRVTEDRFQGQVILSKRADGEDRKVVPVELLATPGCLLMKRIPSLRLSRTQMGTPTACYGVPRMSRPGRAVNAM